MVERIIEESKTKGAFMRLWKIATLWQLWLCTFLLMLTFHVINQKQLTQRFENEAKARDEAIEAERERDDQMACERGLENQERATDKDKREFVGVVTDLINLSDGDPEHISFEERQKLDAVTPVIEARIEREGAATPPPGICVTLGLARPGR